MQNAVFRNQTLKEWNLGFHIRSLLPDLCGVETESQIQQVAAELKGGRVHLPREGFGNQE